MSFTVGNPLFIVQQGQSPLHVVLPVVCRAGEFPNDYFHRTMASENTNTTEIWVYAKHYNCHAVAEHDWGLVINTCQRLVWLPWLSNCGIWTFELEIPCSTSLSSVVPVLECFQQELRLTPSNNCFLKTASFYKLCVYLWHKQSNSVFWVDMLSSGTLIKANGNDLCSRTTVFPNFQQFMSLKTHSL